MIEQVVLATGSVRSSGDGSPSPHYAGFLIRLVADLIDSVILSVASWVIEYLCLALLYGLMKLVSHEPVPSFDDAFNGIYLQYFNLGIYFCLAFPYYVYPSVTSGMTWGKRLFRIRVVDSMTLGPITLRQSIIRFFSYGLSYLVFVCGFLMAAFQPEKRALHDLIAGTVSIIEPKATELNATEPKAIDAQSPI